MSRELLEFLRARLDEDEAIARATLWVGSGHADSWNRPASATVEVGDDDFYVNDRTVAAHIVRHDPARVLREVGAKRELLADYERFVAERRRMMGGWDSYPEVSPVLTAFAAVYADHPDYRAEWRPTP